MQSLWKDVCILNPYQKSDVRHTLYQYRYIEKFKGVAILSAEEIKILIVTVNSFPVYKGPEIGYKICHGKTEEMNLHLQNDGILCT